MNEDVQVLLGEMQLLLSEKRTYYSLLRTGLAVFSVPLTVIVFLLATSDKHMLFSRVVVGGFVVLGLFAIALIGLLMFFQAERKLKQINALIKNIKNQDPRLEEMVL